MITSCLATAGYAFKLPALKDRTFTFGPGLTILFGQNGSGKSTLLRILASYSGCREAGWTAFSSDYVGGFRDTLPFPHRLATRGNQAEVTWDGTPSFYSSGPESGQSGFNNALEDGGEDADNYLRSLLAPGSAGQGQIQWLNMMEKKLSVPPDFITGGNVLRVRGHGKIESGKVNSSWQEAIDGFLSHIRSLPHTGPVTVLLDEPDAHMSLPNQHILWTKAIPRIATGRQVIVATHSAFALCAPDATIIDLQPGYEDRCREAIRALREV